MKVKICLLVVCEDPEDVIWVVQHVDSSLRRKGLGRVNEPLPIVVMNARTLGNSLERGEPMPELFTEAESRLMFGIDSTSTAYLERVNADLKKVCRNSKIRAQAPTVLQMHEVVLQECQKRSLDRVWVQDTTKDATEPKLGEWLKGAGLEVREPQSPGAEYGLWRIQAQLADLQLADKVDTERIFELANNFRGQLSFLAERGDFQAVILDRFATPFLNVEKLTASWGPEIVDGFGLYLDAVADWMYANLTNNAPPPR